jgi:phosphoribosylformylglycinamidine (FGAM) synthase-like enzyme
LFGAEINFENRGYAGDTPAPPNATTLLFNEAQSRVIISCEPKNTERVLSELKSKNIPHAQIGSVITDSLRFTVNGENLSWRIAELHDLWWNSIRRAVESDSEPIPSL